MSVTTLSGNLRAATIVSAVVDLGSVAANTTEEETATVPGVKVGDFVIVEKPTLEAGLSILGARVSAVNTVILTVGNFTVGAIDEVSETLRFLVFRRDGVSDAARVID